MAKKKQEQKKKERERRVAQKKNAAALKRVQEKATERTEKTAVPTKKAYSVESAAKPVYVDTSKRSPFTQRHSIG
jgi:hypothetical protein